MRHLPVVTALVLASGPLFVQQAEKEIVAVISGPELSGGIVSEIMWNGHTVVIQSVVMQKDGTLRPSYHAVAGPRTELRPIPEVPQEAERDWRRKSSQVSPTGFGRITASSDAKLPMYGISSQEVRMNDAIEMGGTVVMHELRVGSLVIHRRRDVAPYDGEVWAWSPVELNRIAYVDEKGDVWIARADGANPERVAKGNYTLPAWSDDGRLLAVAERKKGGREWEISILHLAERYRR